MMLSHISGKPLLRHDLHSVQASFREKTAARDVTLLSGLKNLSHARAFARLFEVWPPYIREDPFQTALSAAVFLRFPHYQFLIVADGVVVGYVATVPVFVDPDCVTLPAEGYTWAIKQSLGIQARERNALCALAAVIDPRFRGVGLSDVLVATLQSVSRAFGFSRLIVPVRPTRKHLAPQLSMHRYLEQGRERDLLADPWVRAHVSKGGVVRNVCAESIVIRARKARWESWLGALVSSGENVIAGGLATMNYDAESDIGTYSEPNVWVDYQVGPPPSAAAERGVS